MKKKTSKIRTNHNLINLICLTFFQLCIVNNLSSQCIKSGEFTFDGLYTHTTTDKYLDSVIYAEVDKLEKYFNIDVDFYFLLEAAGPTAFYTTECNDNCGGSVVLGYNMLIEQMVESEGLKTIKGILAHEFAHAVQRSFDWTEPGKNPELHADFIAGYYIGDTYGYSEEELGPIYYAFASMGDDNFFSPTHHGTPVERLCAFFEGNYAANNLDMTMKNALSFAYSYVRQNSPCSFQTVFANYKIFRKDYESNNLGSVEIKARFYNPLIVEFTNYNLQVITYTVYNKLLLNDLAVNLDYPIRIYESVTNRLRYSDVIKPSIYGPWKIKIGQGNNITIKWPQPSRQ